MDLISDYQSAETKEKPTKMEIWLESLQEKDRDAFFKLASDPSVVLSKLYRICSNNGLECSETAFRRDVYNVRNK